MVDCFKCQGWTTNYTLHFQFFLNITNFRNPSHLTSSSNLTLSFYLNFNSTLHTLARLKDVKHLTHGSNSQCFLSKIKNFKVVSFNSTSIWLDLKSQEFLYPIEQQLETYVPFCIIKSMHTYNFSHHNHGNTTYINYVSKTQQWHIMGPFLGRKIELVFVNVRNIKSKVRYTYFSRCYSIIKEKFFSKNLFKQEHLPWAQLVCNLQK